MWRFDENSSAFQLPNPTVPCLNAIECFPAGSPVCLDFQLRLWRSASPELGKSVIGICDSVEDRRGDTQWRSGGFELK